MLLKQLAESTIMLPDARFHARSTQIANRKITPERLLLITRARVGCLGPDFSMKTTKGHPMGLSKYSMAVLT